MDRTSKFSVSAAAIVLVCFFLPWVQVSCGGAHDSQSGVDLARGGDNSLWLIPVLMIAIILLGVLRVSATQRMIFGFIGLLSGVVSTYLIDHERWRFAGSSGLIAVRLTGWFWLAFLSSIVTAILGAVSFIRRPRSP